MYSTVSYQTGLYIHTLQWIVGTVLWFRQSMEFSTNVSPGASEVIPKDMGKIRLVSKHNKHNESRTMCMLLGCVL